VGRGCETIARKEVQHSSEEGCIDCPFVNCAGYRAAAPNYGSNINGLRDRGQDAPAGVG